MNIDQMDRFGSAIAKLYNERGQIAFIAVDHGHEGDYGPGLGIAIANEPGFYPIPKFYYSTDEFHVAAQKADLLNETLLSITSHRQFEIQCSTMGGKRA